jgi:hypothetical protein
MACCTTSLHQYRAVFLPFIDSEIPFVHYKRDPSRADFEA